LKFDLHSNWVLGNILGSGTKLPVWDESKPTKDPENIVEILTYMITSQDEDVKISPLAQQFIQILRKAGGVMYYII